VIPVPRPAGGLRWIGVVALLVACRSHARVEDCADSLTGVWQGHAITASGERARFHVLDHGQLIEIYPMFDDSHRPAGPPGSPRQDRAASRVAYAPAAIDIRRRGPALVGTRTYRATRGAVTCTITHQAAIRSCAGDELELAWIPTAYIAWDTCQAVESTTWQALRLRRQR